MPGTSLGGRIRTKMRTRGDCPRLPALTPPKAQVIRRFRNCRTAVPRSYSALPPYAGGKRNQLPAQRQEPAHPVLPTAPGGAGGPSQRTAREFRGTLLQNGGGIGARAPPRRGEWPVTQGREAGPRPTPPVTGGQLRAPPPGSGLAPPLLSWLENRGVNLALRPIAPRPSLPRPPPPGSTSWEVGGW